MPFSNLELELIDNVVGGLCRKLNKPVIEELSIEFRIEKHDVVIFERRPAYNQPNETVEIPVAKLKYNRTKDEWQLYWMRADLKWHNYQPLSSSANLKGLVNEVHADPYGCFWG